MDDPPPQEPQADDRPANDRPPATVVLVPGAWHGAWSFERVVPLLESAGVPAIAVDLPGHGDDPGPLTDLHGDAARVREVLDGIDGDVVLFGHSYGGAVITEAGTHPAVRHLVYLAAFAVDDDESCAAAMPEEAEGIVPTDGPNLGEAFIFHADGTVTLEAAGVARFLYNECPPDDVAWAVAHLDAHPLASLGQSPATVAWRSVPSTYVVCTLDAAVHPELQRLMARRCTTTVEWEADHSPFADRPDLLADLLIGLASRSA